MDKSVILVFFASVGILYFKRFTWAFIYWWLPLMLIVPSYLEMDAPGIPPMNFYITALLPFLVFPEIRKSLFQDRHWLDLFVYLFILLVGISELRNEGLSSARQMVFLYSLYYAGPYLAVKYLVLHEKKDAEIALVFVWILAAIAVFNMYEFRFGVNFFLKIRGLWPGFTEGFGIVVMPRWGFFRASGPFVHAIIAGVAFGFAMPLALWLFRMGKFQPPLLGLALVTACFGGLIMTFSRGPIFGAFLALALYFAGQSRLRLQWFSAGCLLMMLLSVPLSFKIAEYMSLTRATAQTTTQETVLYRKELIENYWEVIQERVLLGYGFLRVPVVNGQESIDNAYLLYALNWGIFAALAVLGLGLGACFILFRIGVSRSRLDQRHRGLVWALLGGLAGCLFSIATVYLGSPINTMLFMWAAWAAALQMRKRREGLSEPSTDPALPGTSPPAEPRMIIL